MTGGAPNGPSPATAAQLQDGLLDVPGVDLSRVISGEGSYTFSAWIKPSDLNGDKFLFGQTNQGIHNGIRSGGFLHQGHWGSETNGSTNLNTYDASANDGWVHAAWTYDGATDTAKIYLDGVEDYSGDKRSPNGSGNLIIGGRNGGGDGYVGLIDEIAVWDGAMSSDYITKLAVGLSPLGSADAYQTRTLSVEAAVNGSIIHRAIHKLGATTTVTATPDLGYLLTGWTGDASGSNNPLTLTMDDNKTIGATFNKDTRDTDSDGFSNYDELVTYQTDPVSYTHLTLPTNREV